MGGGGRVNARRVQRHAIRGKVLVSIIARNVTVCLIFFLFVYIFV